MSALRSLALITLLAGESSLLAPALHAQTSTARGVSTKGKAYVPPKRPPLRKAAPPLPGTQPSTDFSVPIPESDTWFNFENGPAMADSRPHQLGLVGVVNFFGSGAGGEYNFAYTPRLSLGGTLFYTQASLKDETTNGATEFMKAQSKSLRLYGRYAIFSWIYGGAGLNFRAITGEYGWKGSAVVSQEIKTDFSASIAAFDFFIGSEWKGPWGTYIGIDWVGLATPLAGKIDYQEQTDIELTSRVLKGETLRQRLDQETRAQLGVYYLNLRIGLSF